MTQSSSAARVKLSWRAAASKAFSALSGGKRRGINRVAWPMRAKAPKAFLPAEGRRREEIVAAFRAYQVQYVDRLRQASGLDLARARVTSPAARWIRIPLGSGFAMMIAHEQRHLAQARRVLEAQGFPR